MERIVSKLAGMGVPALVLMGTIHTTGYAGAAAITTALAAIGPGGMIGGALCLIAAGPIIDGISTFGFDTLFTRVVRELYKNGETKESIERKIRSSPVSKTLKAKLIYEVERLEKLNDAYDIKAEQASTEDNLTVQQ